MLFISEEQCRLWIQQNCPGVERAPSPDDDATLAYGIPPDSSAKTCLARSLCAELTFEKPGLLWVTAWGVFPSGENIELFRGYRFALGEQRPLHAAPGCIFGSSDSARVEALVALSLYFYWDMAIVEGDAGLVARASHDEWLEVRVTDSPRRRVLQERLEKLGLKRLSARSSSWTF